jgi:lysophospholipase L1-like esterase
MRKQTTETPPAAVSVGAVAGLVLPGVRRVRRQLAPFARAWEQANRTAIQADGPLWVALGDSSAQAIGASNWDRGYVGQLLPLLRTATSEHWRVLNLSRSGARIADVLHAQLPLLARLGHRPELVTVSVGANDVWGWPTPRLDALLHQLLARLSARTVIATLPQGLPRRRSERANALIHAEAAAHDLLVADVWSHTGPPWRGKFAAGRFHPNELGYRDWADAFLPAILEATAAPHRDDNVTNQAETLIPAGQVEQAHAQALTHAVAAATSRSA